ncbi:MAG: SDR family NAD(P)-dependent oxidoreductase [Eubacteriales bacterium]|nr:SDR family NAD(P)-dependent oxidoreductase [Eubacteriales bacterium]
MNILITGACGGMGKATTILLKEKGHKIFAIDRKIADRVEGVNYFEADVTKQDELLSIFEAINNRTDRLDVIFNFAGIYNLDSLIEISEEDFVKIFNINLFGIYRVNKVFAPLLKKNGKVVITSSELAPLYPLPFTGLYAITKAALEKYADSLRMELNLLDIKVSVIRPGAVKTDLLDVSTTALDRFCENTDLYKCNAERFKKIVDNVESKKIEADKIAKIALKIVNSNQPKYVYNINRNVMLRLLNILPKRWQVAIIKRIIK